MDKREEISKIIKEEFDKLKGKKIKPGSIVVKYLDKKIYQVQRKDSRLVSCLTANSFLFPEEKNKTETVLFKDEVCLYFELWKNVEKRMKEEK